MKKIMNISFYCDECEKIVPNFALKQNNNSNGDG